MSNYNLVTSFSYQTTDYPNIQIVDWKIQGKSGSTLLNIVPLPAETEIVFWQRVQTELNLALQNQFWYAEPILLNTPTTIGTSTVVSPQKFEDFKTNTVVLRQYTNFVTPNDSQNLVIVFSYSDDNTTAAAETSYNNEIARSQDDVPPLA